MIGLAIAIFGGHSGHVVFGIVVAILGFFWAEIMGHWFLLPRLVEWARSRGASHQSTVDKTEVCPMPSLNCGEMELTDMGLANVQTQFQPGPASAAVTDAVRKTFASQDWEDVLNALTRVFVVVHEDIVVIAYGNRPDFDELIRRAEFDYRSVKLILTNVDLRFPQLSQLELIHRYKELGFPVANELKPWCSECEVKAGHSHSQL